MAQAEKGADVLSTTTMESRILSSVYVPIKQDHRLTDSFYISRKVSFLSSTRLFTRAKDGLDRIYWRSFVKRCNS